MLLNLLCPLWSQAQDAIFHHLTYQNGLAQNTILSIAQDNRGFMWFGTPNGLSRYDSRQLKNFSYSPDTTSLPSNNVTALYYSNELGLLVGTEYGLARYDPVYSRFHTFFRNARPDRSLTSNSIRCIAQDEKGNFWIGTDNGLNFVRFLSGVPQVEKLLERLPSGNCRIYQIAQDPAGRIWAATSQGLFQVTEGGRGHQTKLIQPTKTPSAKTTAVCNDGENLWVGTSEGDLTRLNYLNEAWYTTTASDIVPAGRPEKIQTIVAGKDGSIWVGTEHGLFQKRKTESLFRLHNRNTADPRALSDDDIMSAFCDRDGTIWLGTYHSGVNVTYPGSYPFKPITLSTGNEPGLISKIQKDLQGNLWMNSYSYGVLCLNAKDKRVRRYPDLDESSTLYLDRSGHIWAASRENATIARYDDKTDRWQRFSLTIPSQAKKQQFLTYSMLQDSRGRYWIGTAGNGLFLFDPATGKSREVLGTSQGLYRTVDNLLEDKHGNIWFSCNPGVGMIKPGSGKVRWYSTRKPDFMQSGKGIVMSMHEDGRGTIWFGVFNDGLWKYDPQGDRLIRAGETFLKSDNTILNLVSDKQGYLWMSDDLGLVRWHPVKNVVQYYPASDGLPGVEIAERSAYRDEQGEIFFGTNNGAFHFDPASIPISLNPPVIAFTGLKLFNRPVKIGDRFGVLEKDINETGALTLRHEHAVFSVDFAVLNFVRPEKNRYAYKLDGFEKNWNYVDVPTATYTNLSPGNYALLVKGANQDGIWNEAPSRLTVRILPPWYRTWWAYLLYALSTAGIVFTVLRFFWMRESFRRDNELHQAKLDFFTNISHEIRTHLSLILGPVERVLSEKSDIDKIHKQLQYVKSNSEQLRGLVTELLDFRKAESRTMQLHIGKHELVSFLSTIFEAFRNLASEKEITSHFHSNNPRIELWYDPEQLTKVIFNLLVNAYKFTPKGGTVKLEVEELHDRVQIRVSDNGQGIAPQHLGNLFQNFFQVYQQATQNTGYGIGLALSKAIIEQHKGKLLVDSQEARESENGATTFTVELSKGYLHFGKDKALEHHLPDAVLPATNNAQDAAEATDPEDLLPIILVIEDHEELRDFIREALETSYNVLTASNGKDGLRLATEHIPDVIVSDIMMAEMDGLTLCASVKDDERTSHIPVILLTAKATDEHKIEGLEKGADAYLTKPFSTRVLELCIHNLLAAKKLMREKYARQITLGPGGIEIENVDEKFLHRIIAITEEFMPDPDFGVDKLSREVGMSRPVLYKKIKSLTGMSVNDFTKTLRLKRAAQLLEQSQYNVNEVAFLVGYSDRRYFTREFGKMFGKAPSEMRREQKEDEA